VSSAAAAETKEENSKVPSKAPSSPPTVLPRHPPHRLRRRNRRLRAAVEAVEAQRGAQAVRENGTKDAITTMTAATVFIARTKAGVKGV